MAHVIAGRKFRVAGQVRACNDQGVDAKVACSLLGVAIFAVVACDGEVAPPVVRVHDEISPPVAMEMPTTQAQPTDVPDASTDSPYGTFDDAGYVRGYAVSPIQVCKQCACEA